jgi:hypothetical protein
MLRVFTIVNIFLAATLVDKIYFEGILGALFVPLLVVVLAVERALSVAV